MDIPGRWEKTTRVYQESPSIFRAKQPKRTPMARERSGVLDVGPWQGPGGWGVP